MEESVLFVAPVLVARVENVGGLQVSMDGFTIVAVNNAESAGTVADFRNEFGLTFPLVMDEQATIQEQYGIFSYPSTLMIDENGVIVARHFGTLTTEQIDELIELAVES